MGSTQSVPAQLKRKKGWKRTGLDADLLDHLSKGVHLEIQLRRLELRKPQGRSGPQQVGRQGKVMNGTGRAALASFLAEKDRVAAVASPEWNRIRLENCGCREHHSKRRMSAMDRGRMKRKTDREGIVGGGCALGNGGRRGQGGSGCCGGRLALLAAAQRFEFLSAAERSGQARRYRCKSRTPAAVDDTSTCTARQRHPSERNPR